MVIDRLICGPGTTEEEWSACDDLQSLPLASVESLVPGGSRLVICAPHPDDEILPCAGLLVAAHDLGRRVVILALTDGEGSHGPDSRLTPDLLRELRPRETADALRRLEVAASIDRFGLPDGQLTNLETMLELEFARRFCRDDVVVAPWRLDGHPDHEAATRAALKAAARIGCIVLEAPIWGWHWSHPLNTPMPWQRGVRFPMSEAHDRRKLAAIRAFESQLMADGDAPPILTETTLARFARPWEVFFQ